MESSNSGDKANLRKVIAVVAVLVVIVLIVFGAAALGGDDKSDTESGIPKDNTSASEETREANPKQADTTANATYKDGTYTATGSYNSPGGQQEITITTDVRDGIITNTSAVSGANDPTARDYQEDFISGYKQQVVGKKIDEVNLSRVSGSSLTSKGFNDAIDDIQQQAKA